MTKLLAALIAATFATGAVYAADPAKKADAKPAAKKEDKKPAEAPKK